MRYKIAWIEQKSTKDGKPKAEATLVGETESENATGVKVTIWGDFPNYGAIVNGGMIEGEIVPSRDPKYLPSLKPSVSPKMASRGNFKAEQVERVMDKKNASISQFQDNKEEAIRLASAQRDAVLLVTTFYKSRWENDPILESEFDVLVKKKIIEWRDWFLSSNFTDVIPF